MDLINTINTDKSCSVAVIGGGPAGLMAAEVLIQAGVRVDLYDSMPSVGMKFIIAGKGGLNLTHAETKEAFLSHYGKGKEKLRPFINEFGPETIREWVHGLGISTFVGSSGRVFPIGMKSKPILSAWLKRLRTEGVSFHNRHNWVGWSDGGSLLFETPEGVVLAFHDAVVLALGGGSWPQLGSTGSWVPILLKHGIQVSPLRPSNCGFDVVWSDYFRNRFEGFPVQSVILSFTDSIGNYYHKQGEFIVTATGIEGNLIYALSAPIRDEIDKNGTLIVKLDLAPGWSHQRLLEKLFHPRGSKTISRHLEKTVHIKGVKVGLLREFVSKEIFADTKQLVLFIKELPVPLIASRPLDEAISTAGGILFEELDENLMLQSIPGNFCAGEMLDWEAPTGGYLLTACFATGRKAGLGALSWLKNNIIH